MSGLLVRGGTLVTVRGRAQADLLIEGERIAALGPNLQAPGAEILDATGKLVLPGGIDPHTHFDLPMFDTVSADDHYSGLKAAAFGGTTTVLDFVPQDQRSLAACVEAWHAKADARAPSISVST